MTAGGLLLDGRVRRDPPRPPRHLGAGVTARRRGQRRYRPLGDSPPCPCPPFRSPTVPRPVVVEPPARTGQPRRRVIRRQRPTRHNPAPVIARHRLEHPTDIGRIGAAAHAALPRAPRFRVDPGRALRVVIVPAHHRPHDRQADPESIRRHPRGAVLCGSHARRGYRPPSTKRTSATPRYPTRQAAAETILPCLSVAPAKHGANMRRSIRAQQRRPRAPFERRPGGRAPRRASRNRPPMGTHRPRVVRRAALRPAPLSVRVHRPATARARDAGAPPRVVTTSQPPRASPTVQAPPAIPSGPTDARLAAIVRRHGGRDRPPPATTAGAGPVLPPVTRRACPDQMDLLPDNPGGNRP